MVWLSGVISSRGISLVSAMIAATLSNVLLTAIPLLARNSAPK
jgi:hypothetical protein